MAQTEQPEVYQIARMGKRPYIITDRLRGFTTMTTVHTLLREEDKSLAQKSTDDILWTLGPQKWYSILRLFGTGRRKVYGALIGGAGTERRNYDVYDQTYARIGLRRRELIVVDRLKRRPRNRQLAR